MEMMILCNRETKDKRKNDSSLQQKKRLLIWSRSKERKREREKKQFPLFDVKAKEFISLLINCYKNSVFNYKREPV